MKERTMYGTVKKIGILAFLGGMFMTNPLIQSLGAIAWGIVTIIELVTKKNH